MEEFSRRAFLRGAGAGVAAGLLAACSPKRGASPSPVLPGSLAGSPSGSPQGSPVPSPVPTTAASPGPPDWAALRARLSGPLLLPGDGGYPAAAQAYNPLFDGNHPAAVAKCRRVEDVQACVALAAAGKVPIAARSGGHSYAGYSVPAGGLVVDLSGMSGATAQPGGTAVVGAGARLIDVYAGLAQAGRCVPGGSCPTVGIAGLTLGGGVGVLARQFGLTCDHLVSATVVGPDAVVRTASATSEPDLFWALRGGGGGNAGIVTSFTFATVAAPQVVVMAMSFPGVSASAVLAGWQAWVQAAPGELWTNCILSAGSPPTARVNASFLGSMAAAGGLLDDLARRVGTSSAHRTVSSKGFLDAMLYFAGCASEGVAGCRLTSQGGTMSRESFVASSRVMAAPVADPGKVAALVAGRSGMDVIFDALGGAVATVAPDATAFPHRTALATVQIYQGTTATGRAAALQAVGEVRDGLAPLVGSGAYVNYIDPALAGWPQAYYGANLPRLRQVVAAADPDGVFTFPQSVRSA